MLEISDNLDSDLRSAAPEFDLTADFTQRVMMQTVYRQRRVRPGGFRYAQLRLAGISMIIAGCFIMVSHTVPVNHSINNFKTTWYAAVDEVPQVQIPLLKYQLIKDYNHGGRLNEKEL